MNFRNLNRNIRKKASSTEVRTHTHTQKKSQAFKTTSKKMDTWVKDNIKSIKSMDNHAEKLGNSERINSTIWREERKDNFHEILKGNNSLPKKEVPTRYKRHINYLFILHLCHSFSSLLSSKPFLSSSLYSYPPTHSSSVSV